MTVGDRVKKIRTDKNMSLEKFGSRLGVSKVAISKIERGENALTPQMCKLICCEFNVSEEWLRTGTGNQKKPTLDDEIGKVVEKYSLDSMEELIIREYLDLKDEQRQVFKEYLKKLRQSILSASIQYDSAADQEITQEKNPSDMTPEELHASLDAQLDCVKEGEKKDTEGTA